MPVEQGGWTTYGERALYESPWVTLRAVDVESPAGERYDHHVVELPEFASALVVAEGHVLLLWKYRFLADRWGYELPGGLVDPGESPERAAARETAEETGHTVAGEGEHLFTTDPLPGQVRTHGYVYRWHAAEAGDGPTDPEESTTTVTWVPLTRALELVRAGRMLDSVAATAILYQEAERRAAG